MTEFNLIQIEAELLIAMEKHRASDELYFDPFGGQSLTIPLHSPDKRENFILDVSRGRINLHKGTYQNRARQVIVLVRLDFGGAPHQNPDGEVITCPHIHLYREGYNDKWAYPLSSDDFSDSSDSWAMLHDFMRYCKITQPPHIEQRLFT